MNRFELFSQDELLHLRGGLLSTSTYGYDTGSDKLYKEVEEAWDAKEKARVEALPKCGKCGHILK